MSTFDDLTCLLPIPQSPIHTDVEQLHSITADLPTEFPSDFLRFCETYGSGDIRFGMYSFNVVSAFSPHYPPFARTFYQCLAELRAALGDLESGLTLYPEPDGLLPFAVTTDGTHFCWQTKERPDRWKVAWIYSFDEGQYKIFDIGFADFLLAFLTKQIQPPELGYDYNWEPSTDLKFVPDG